MTANADAKKRFNASPMLQLMHFEIVNADNGMAEVRAVPDHGYDNQMARMHGGYVASLIDTVMGCAVMTSVPAHTGFGTVDLNVKFVRKIDVDTGPLTATATVLHAGRTMLTAEARVVDAVGTLYAHGSGTFLVYPKQVS